MARKVNITVETDDPPLTKKANVAIWVLQIFIALFFFFVGGAKIAGVPATVAVFEKIGAGQWFRYLTGSLEILGALFLLIPKAGFYGAILLCFVMICAIITHLTLLGGTPLPAALFLILNAAIAYLRRPRKPGNAP